MSGAESHGGSEKNPGYLCVCYYMNLQVCVFTENKQQESLCVCRERQGRGTRRQGNEEI